MPFLEPLMEVLRYDVPCNTGESHSTLAPLLEVEVKLVILHPLDAADILLRDPSVLKFLMAALLKFVRLTALA